jgi:hypothetical protein
MLLAWVVASTPLARAQTDEIQVYDAEITAPGRLNLTWHNNFTPSGRSQPALPGGVVPDHALNGVPEFAYGVTDWFEAGLYAGIYTLTRDGRLLFDGAKLRALFVAPHAHDRRFFYGVNFELSYNTPHWALRRYAGEIRPIFGVHLGRFDLIANPIVDTDFNGFGKLDFAPAARIACGLSDRLAVALEHYADFGPVEHFAAHSDRAQTLYAVLDYGGSGNGIEFGVGRGWTRASDSVVVKLMLMHDF